MNIRSGLYTVPGNKIFITDIETRWYWYLYNLIMIVFILPWFHFSRKHISVCLIRHFWECNKNSYDPYLKTGLTDW